MHDALDLTQLAGDAWYPLPADEGCWCSDACEPQHGTSLGDEWHTFAPRRLNCDAEPYVPLCSVQLEAMHALIAANQELGPPPGLE